MSTLSRMTGRDASTRRRQQKQAADPYNPSTQIGPAMQQQQGYAGEDRNRFLDLLGGGQDALNTSIQAAVSAAMPGLQQTLQGSREEAIRRGISTGDLGTSNEGDILSAFQRNIANSAGSQALALHQGDLGAAQGLYEGDQNRYLDLLSGQLDRKQASKNAKAQSRDSLYGGMLGIIGSGLGGYLGGRAGKGK